MQDQPGVPTAAPQLASHLTEAYVEQLELCLHEGKFSKAAAESLRWVQQCLPDGTLHSPLGLRLLFVSIQSHFMICRQAELQQLLEKGGHGVLGLQPEAFILWQVMQLECGEASICKAQIKAYMQDFDGSAQAAATDSSQAQSVQLDTGPCGVQGLDMQQQPQEPQQQQVGQAPQEQLQGAGQPHQCNRQPPGRHVQGQKHALPLCRLFAVDVLSEALQQYSNANDFLVGPDSIARRLLQEDEVAMLQSEVTGLQLAAAVRQQEANIGTVAQPAAAQQDGMKLAAQYCTMLGELNDEARDLVDDGSGTPPQNRHGMGVWHSVRAAASSCVAALGIHGLVNRAGSSVPDVVAAPAGAPAAMQDVQQQVEGTDGSNVDHQVTAQPSYRDAALLGQGLQKQGVVNKAASMALSKVGVWWKLALEHGAGQLGDVLYALIASLLLYALYKEWKAIRAAFKRPLSAIRAPVRDLLSMAFALSPNPIASGRMPAGRRL